MLRAGAVLKTEVPAVAGTAEVRVGERAAAERRARMRAGVTEHTEAVPRPRDEDLSDSEPRDPHLTRAQLIVAQELAPWALWLVKHQRGGI